MHAVNFDGARVFRNPNGTRNQQSSANAQVDDFTGALDYFRVEGSKVRTSSFSILYELASEQNKVDALNEIANQYAAEYGVSKEQAHSKMLNLIRAKANLTRIKNRL